ncbi:adenosylcobinamide-GDP ribazoletransferase [Prochlorococcus marinus]|uniref:Adenosylcobinamide-GDP ribazoletransferase n=1 Tax=Prochlorococcus marinus (strain MIT 9211) TaxID=93059 RepID=A9BDP2_PROM4|nr:adenosylcobinamide-GDP ribazoletransferase [Prochlorococcus marinus]ABX08228.1 Cobalamin-5-phosphate synthase CobS [Prochlorococcus marinus str. MIT 9211]
MLFRALKKFFLIPPNWLKDFAGAWVFYTILPHWPGIKPQFKRIARFGPAIGFFIGCIQITIWLILSKLGWPTESLALISVALAIYLTGGLHFDGLIDTADGIAAGQEKQMEAMKDSNAGAIGSLAIIAIILIQISALLKLNNLSIIAIPIASFFGRISPLWAIDKFPYLKDKGMGKFHKDNWKGFLKEIIPSLIIIVIISTIFSIIPETKIVRFNLLIGTLVGTIPVFLIPNWLGNRLGGHNGDSYGASCVLTETLMLIILGFFLEVY